MAKNEKFNLIKTNIKESTLVNPLINTDIKMPSDTNEIL